MLTQQSSAVVDQVEMVVTCVCVRIGGCGVEDINLMEVLPSSTLGFQGHPECQYSGSRGVKNMKDCDWGPQTGEHHFRSTSFG